MGETLDVLDVERVVGEESQSTLGRGGAAEGEFKIILPGLRRVIAPKTAGQRDYLQAIAQHDIVIGIGPAGAGETYLPLAAAGDAPARQRQPRIILPRPPGGAGGGVRVPPGRPPE